MKLWTIKMLAARKTQEESHAVKCVVQAVQRNISVVPRNIHTAKFYDSFVTNLTTLV